MLQVYCVACAIGPSVNTFFIFHIFRIEIKKIWQHSKIEGPTDFSFQTEILQFLKFPATILQDCKFWTPKRGLFRNLQV